MDPNEIFTQVTGKKFTPKASIAPTSQPSFTLSTPSFKTAQSTPATMPEGQVGTLQFLKDIFTGKDNTGGGVLRNTIKGIPKAAKDLVTGSDEFAPDKVLGVARNTVLGLPKAAAEFPVNLAKGIYNQQVNPDAEQQDFESKMLPYAPKSDTIGGKTARIVSAPGVFAARQITRFVNPGLRGLGNDLAEIIAIQEPGGIADQVASGKIPASVLDEFAVLHKTNPQIVGDVAQAVLTAYAGGAAEGQLSKSTSLTARQALKQGGIQGLKVGTVFGVAQAASSGSTNPLEIASTVGTGGAAGSVFGAITSGAIPVSKEAFRAVQEAKIKYDAMTPAQKQGGYVKNPFAGDSSGDVGKTPLDTTSEKKTGQEIVDYVDGLDRSVETEYVREKDKGILPYTKKQIEESQSYEKKTLSIDDLIANDPDLKEYIDANEQRYPEGQVPDGITLNLDNPIVVGKKGEVIDGMNRILTLKNSGEKTIEGYTPIESASKGVDTKAPESKFRSGEPVFKENTDVVARQRFNIPDLEKVSFGGSDRDVYALGDGNVVKIAKSARGLAQNDFSSDYYAENAGVIPKTIEIGKNYIVKEQAFPPNTLTKQLVSDLKRLGFDDLKNKSGKFWDVVEKYKDDFPLDDLANYDYLPNDLTAIRNWGTTKDGKPILIDEGTLNGAFVKEYQGKANMSSQDFRDVYYESRAAKKAFEDMDPKTKYEIRKSLEGDGKISPEEGTKIIRTMFDENEIRFITGDDISQWANMSDEAFAKNLQGFYKPRSFAADLIGVVEKNGKIESSTVYHEAFHAYLNNFVDRAEKKSVIEYIKRSKLAAPGRETYSRKAYETSDARAEEWLADDFARYVKNKTADARLKPFYEKMLDKVRDWIRKKGDLETLYERILNKDRSVVNPKTRRLDITSFKVEKGKGAEGEPKKKLSLAEFLSKKKEEVAQGMQMPGEKTTEPSKQPVKTEATQNSKEGKQIDEAISYANDIPKFANEKVNLDNLKISDEGKALVEKTVEEIKPQIEKKIGKVLSNQEAIALANDSSKILKNAVSRETTLEWEASLLRARQKLSQSAESGIVDKEFIDNLMAVKTYGTDIARKLQSFSIGAEPKNITSKEAIIQAVLDLTGDADKILKEAEGVDFTNLKQATDFYRKFVEPTKGEWLDLIRYNSMLSSPNTHIINVFSNLMNSSLIAPIEKSLTGGLDFIGSKITGKERSAFAGEGAAYLKNYFSSIGEATSRLGGVLKGTRSFTNLDTKYLPIATSGVKGKVVGTLAIPMKLLEGMDQFFSALAEGGQKAALEYRKSKGVDVGNIETAAFEDAQYRLYRQELHNEKQGHVLDAVDHVTGSIQKLRNSKNPIISTIAKFTVPFLQTPMNIFKQGIEYSPAGLTTLFGAANKTEQLSKAIIGSTVFMSAATLLASNRLTWGEPTNPDQKAQFRGAGKLPYSVKVGDTWYSYQKLPPAIAFPFAMVASIDDLVKTKKITQSNADMILSGIAKYGQFLADQSYMKSIGDTLTAFKGGQSGFEQVLSNYPQQLIPFRALGGWMTRLFDETQRQVDNKAGFVDKQMQFLMMNIPGLSQNVPARLDPEGNPIPQPNRLFNLFSPIKTSTEDSEKAAKYLRLEEYNKFSKDVKALKAEDKAKFQPAYEEIQSLIKSGKKEDAQTKFNALSEYEHELYQSFKDSENAKKRTAADKEFLPIYTEIQKLKAAGDPLATEKFNALSEDQHKIYDRFKKNFKGETPETIGDQPSFDDNKPVANDSIVSSVATYAKAIGTDPVTAFNRIFTGQKIRRIDNGTIIVERMSLADSQKVKTDRGGNNVEMKLDHTIPLELGGSNDEDNLSLVPTDTWKGYTPVENFLAKQLKAGKLTKAEAQDRITKFKLGQISKEEAMKTE